MTGSFLKDSNPILEETGQRKESVICHIHMEKMEGTSQSVCGNEGCWW